MRAVIILNKTNIEKLIDEQLSKLIKHEPWIDNDFNPEEASGGNFDEAFQLGYEYGIEIGRLEALRNLI